MRPGVRPKSLLGRYLTNQWTEFHQTLVDDVVAASDELNRFWKSKGQGQGRYEVECLSELLRLAEACTSTLVSKCRLVRCAWVANTHKHIRINIGNQMQLSSGRIFLSWLYGYSHSFSTVADQWITILYDDICKRVQHLLLSRVFYVWFYTCSCWVRYLYGSM